MSTTYKRGGFTGAKSFISQGAPYSQFSNSLEFERNRALIVTQLGSTGKRGIDVKGTWDHVTLTSEF